VRDRIVDLCPQARVEIGHGQMDADELEGVMARFIAGKTDVLVCTTIIESGLDIPNANTIIIDRADQFGLADLYQLRGRVGRAEHKAYAYLLLPRELMTVGAARKRISAIKQYSSLGAGFRIAMRDLEIRGAGSILGTAQSRDVAEVTTHDQLDRLRRVWQDRFGSFPPAVDNLFSLIEIKLAAAKSGITRVEVRERKLMLTRRGDFILVAGKFPRLIGAKIEQHLGEILELIKKL
jgi:transcription-repair coupling factor (superfamily II helicase)